MARVQLKSMADGTVVDTTGKPQPAVPVTILIHNTSTPATVYTAETGGTTLTQPLLTDAKGQVPGWIPDQQEVDFSVVYGGVTTVLEGDPVRGDNPMLSAYLDVRDVAYGAKGDGVTDDSAAISAAITAAAVTGQMVFFPKGTYKCASAISLNNGCAGLFGESSEASKIVFADLGAATAIVRGPVPNNTPKFIRDLSIQGPSVPVTLGTAANQVLGLAVGTLYRVERVTITGFKKGIAIYGDHNNFDHVLSRYNHYNLSYESAGIYVANNTHRSCMYTNAGMASIVCVSGGFVTGDLFSEVHMGFSPYGFFKETPGGAEGFILNTVFDCMYFEQCSYGLIYDATGTCSVDGDTWVGCIQTGTFTANFNIPSSPPPKDYAVVCGTLLRQKIIGGETKQFSTPGAKGIFKSSSVNDFSHDSAGTGIDNVNAVSTSGAPVFYFTAPSGQLDRVRLDHQGTEARVYNLDRGATNTAVNDVMYSTGSERAGPTGAGQGVLAAISGVALSAAYLQNDTVIVARRGKVTVNLGTLAADLPMGSFIGPSGNVDGVAKVVLTAPAAFAYTLAAQTAGASKTVSAELGLLAAPSADPLLPWLVQVNPLLGGGTAAFRVGTWIPFVDTTSIMNGWLTNSSVTVNDAIAWDVVLSAGTWTFTMMNKLGPNLAIATVTVGAIAAGTIDLYSAGVLYNNVEALTGIVVPTSGKYRVQLQALTKNASSSGFALVMQQLQLLRTA